MIKRCEYCGKPFETKILKKRFCCPKCRQKAGYITEALNLDNKIKKIVEKREKKKPEVIYKIWDFKDRECSETWAFIKTIKPIDFKALFSSEKENLKTKKEYKKHYDKRG